MRNLIILTDSSYKCVLGTFERNYFHHKECSDNQIKKAPHSLEMYLCTTRKTVAGVSENAHEI